MLYGANNICCNCYSITKEIKFSRDLFRQNFYPGVTFENCVKCFADSKFIPCKKQAQQEGISQFINIPYFRHPSISFACKLRQSFKKPYKVNLLCSFNTKEIKNFFSLKCPTPISLKTNVVYKFNCFL